MLLGRQRKDAGWHSRLTPYWESLRQANGSFLCQYSFTENEISMLQSNGMVSCFTLSVMSHVTISIQQ